MQTILIKSEQSPFTKKTNFIILLLSIILLFNVFINDANDKPPHYITFAILLCIIILFLVKLFRSFIKKDFKTIGSLIISDEKIEININGVVKKHDTHLLKSLKLTYNGYDGESYPPSLRGTLSDFRQKQGNLNFLEFQVESNIFIFEFYLQSWNQNLMFFRLMRTFETKGIPFIFKNEYGTNDIYKKYN